MFSLRPAEVTPAIRQLFDLTQPTMPRAFNVLEGVTQGQMVVDDPAQPRWAVVREGIYGTLYFGGHLPAAQLPAIFNHFFQFGGLGVGCWPDDPLNQMLPPNPDYMGFTLYFQERASAVSLETVRPPLPAPYAWAKRDEPLFRQSFDYDATVAAFGTLEKVLHYTLGVAIVHANRLLCEAATGAPTQGRIEVGVTTHEHYRQQGLATFACAQLIALCEAQGYATWWDCAQHNVPSVRLARKLGYGNEQVYQYRWWEKR